MTFLKWLEELFGTSVDIDGNLNKINHETIILFSSICYAIKRTRSKLETKMPNIRIIEWIPEAMLISAAEDRWIEIKGKRVLYFSYIDHEDPIIIANDLSEDTVYGVTMWLGESPESAVKAGYAVFGEIPDRPFSDYGNIA